MVGCVGLELKFLDPVGHGVRQRLFHQNLGVVLGRRRFEIGKLYPHLSGEYQVSPSIRCALHVFQIHWQLVVEVPLEGERADAIRV